MDRILKERLVGAAVLVMIAVIVIPMILTGTPEHTPITDSNIPPLPEHQFKSRIIPLKPPEPLIGAAPSTGVIVPSTGTADNSSIQTDIVGSEQIQSPDAGKEFLSRQPDPVEFAEQRDGDYAEKIGLSAWVVQLGSFNTEENAEALSQKLRKAGYPAFVEPVEREGGNIYRVRVGPELFEEDADSLLEELKKNMNIDGIVLNYP